MKIPRKKLITTINIGEINERLQAARRMLVSNIHRPEKDAIYKPSQAVFFEAALVMLCEAIERGDRVVDLEPFRKLSMVQKIPTGGIHVGTLETEERYAEDGLNVGRIGPGIKSIYERDARHVNREGAIVAVRGCAFTQDAPGSLAAPAQKFTVMSIDRRHATLSDSAGREIIMHVFDLRPWGTRSWERE